METKRKTPLKPKPKAKGCRIAFTPEQLIEVKKAAAAARITIEQYVILATLEKIIIQYQR